MADQRLVIHQLQRQLEFLTAQAAQFRLLMGVLVKRLGEKQTISDADFQAMAKEGAHFVMRPVPGKRLDDGTATPDALELIVVSGEDVKTMHEEAPRIVAPEPSLIVQG